jgi:NRPS condensation-like uncharacterized protein
MVFLKNLAAQYITLKYGETIPTTHGILDCTKSPTEQELKDCFLSHAGQVSLSRRDTDAWRIDGEREEDGFLNLTCFKIPVLQSLEKAHEFGVTLTVFMSAVIMKAILNLQKETVSNPKKQKLIKLLIPVNLRPLFNEDTIRNFAMFTIPEINPRLGEYTFEEIVKVVYHKMGSEVNAKYMSQVITTNVNDEKNPLVRLVPLPIKNLVMKAVFNSVGERKSCLSFSNLGQVKLPENMQKYVQRFDFILGVQATAPYNCGMLSFKDTVYINFIRNIKDATLERHFFKVLKELGITPQVESNKNER